MCRYVPFSGAVCEWHMETKERIAYPIDEGFKVAGVTRTRGYQLIATGELETFRLGRRRMVTRRALQRCIDRLEAKHHALPRESQ